MSVFVDSHCHINFPEFAGRTAEVLARMHTSHVTHALCVAVNRADLPRILELADQHREIFASVGVHPDHTDEPEPSVDDLVKLADHRKVVAIGETGLDYFRLAGDMHWQRERFRKHIRAARSCNKPLIIHTRAAAADTIEIMRQEGAAAVGGVMHCFTETFEIAQAAMDLGFRISFSGIVTFKSARELQDVARRVPLDNMLIETDSPYLAPVPFRGKVNEPSYVTRVAYKIAELKDIPIEEVGRCTTDNFFRLFPAARK